MVNVLITVQGNSTVTFNDNYAANGEVMIFHYNHAVNITFQVQGNSTVTFTDNRADNNGGVMYIGDRPLSIVKFQENSTTTFNNNEALRDGGAIYLSDHSSFTQLKLIILMLLFTLTELAIMVGLFMCYLK